VTPKSLIRYEQVRRRGAQPDVAGSDAPFSEGRYFDANCAIGDLVSNFVYVTGVAAGIPNVTTANPQVKATMPAAGVIVAKPSSTTCLVQVSGLITTYAPMVAGTRYYIGSDGRPTATAPISPAVSQMVGVALDTGKLLLTPSFNEGGGISPTGGGGWIIIRDVSATGGVVSNKVYQDSGSTVLQSCTASTGAVLVSIRASAPLVTVGGVAATLALAADGGHYAGNVAVTVSGAGGAIVAVVTLPDGEAGAIDTVVVAISAPPQILTLAFTGNYPGTQTELKAGDTFSVTGTTDVPCTGVQSLDFEAAVASTWSQGAATTFVVSVIIANRGNTLQQLHARLQARDASGAYGATRDTSNTVACNNLRPTVTFGAVTYPGTQGALKGSETANVAVTLANLSSVVFSSPNGDLSITAPTTIAPTKVATRVAGSYNVGTNNIQAIATRAANNSTTTGQGLVKIANLAASLAVTTPAARLRSGGNDGTAVQNHTITLTSDQILAGTPTLEAGAGGGSFTGSWAGGPSVWTRVLQVRDTDVKGTYNWSTPSATNLAGLVVNFVLSGSTYVLGGFVPRNLTFSFFSQTTTMNVPVVTYSKLQAGLFTATNQPAIKMATQGSHTDSADHFTVDALNTSPVTLWWNDVAAASSNSSGTAQILSVEELA
jgi:hypothetical protein